MKSWLTTSIEVAKPFDWLKTINYPVQSFPHPIYHVQGEQLQRVIWLTSPGGGAAHPWLLKLGPAEEKQHHWRLHVAGTLWAASPAAGTPSLAPADFHRRQLQQVAATIVSADHDLSALAQAVAGDPVMAQVEQEHRGLRILRLPNLFEALADAIIGQQISVTAANSIRRRLMFNLAPGAGSGHAQPGPSSVPWPYLAPEPTAKAPVADLARWGLGQRRAEYLAGVARLAAAGKLPNSSLNRLPLPKAVAQLTALRGVGPWTAQLALLFGRGRTDVWPAGDLGLRDAVGQVYGLSQRPNEAQVRQLAENWPGWASYAAYYLWGLRRLPGKKE